MWARVTGGERAATWQWTRRWQCAVGSGQWARGRRIEHNERGCVWHERREPAGVRPSGARGSTAGRDRAFDSWHGCRSRINAGGKEKGAAGGDHRHQEQSRLGTGSLVLGALSPSRTPFYRRPPILRRHCLSGFPAYRDRPRYRHRNTITRLTSGHSLPRPNTKTHCITPTTITPPQPQPQPSPSPSPPPPSPPPPTPSKRESAETPPPSPSHHLPTQPTMSAGVPLTPEYLFEALQAASSQSQDLVQNASAQLKTWERNAGYWSMLQVCASSPALLYGWS